MNETYNQLAELLQSYSWAGNSGWDYALAGAIFVGLWLGLYIFHSIVLAYLKKAAKRTKNQYDDIIIDILKNVGPKSYFVVSLYVGVRYLQLVSWLDKVVMVVFLLFIAFEIVKACKSIFDFYIDRHLRKLDNANEKSSTKSILLTARGIMVAVLWVVLALMLLSNLGVNVTSLAASLGIGGIALALAVQNILGDLFSAFSIYLDKPFRIGDLIVVGEDSGVVEKIGLKTTRIRTLSGEELIISNKELTSTRIHNYKTMQKRRDDFQIGVVYGTTKDKLANIPNMIKDIISGIDKLEYVRCHLITYGDFSLNFEVVYNIDSSDFDEFRDSKQKLLLAIFDRFGQEKIEFAYPTQEIIVHK